MKRDIIQLINDKSDKANENIFEKNKIIWMNMIKFNRIIKQIACFYHEASWIYIKLFAEWMFLNKYQNSNRYTSTN
jgi:hypothetical protein